RDVDSLKRETHLYDEDVVEELLEAGIHPGTIQALALVPAVQVAWAGGFVETAEREAVLKAAHSVGIIEESATGQLLVSWLDHKPGPELFTAWKDYVAALHTVLKPVIYRQLRQSTIETARRIAEAAGGFLGVYSVSVAEQRIIHQVEEAFEP
ncbi:MAG: hypothetical protein KDA89_22635, partial [Planctomycetaceae bacterium]|nr:hypothetical protein [Planctomycetaceae bacterium]